MVQKTNAVRMLEAAGVAHELKPYDLDMEDFNAVAVAELIGLPPATVFKTLVAIGDKAGPCFAVVPADCELDLKALAKASGNRKMTLAALRDVEPLTGYRRGGVTAIGPKKPFPVYLDATAEDLVTIAVSGGTKGLQIALATSDYITETNAELAPISRPPGP